jgi:hypothetical protein
MSSIDGTIDYTVKQSDTLPLLQATLYDATGLPINLTGATVKLKVRGVFDSVLKVNAACTIVNALLGTISYQWTAVDCDTAGEYYLEFEIVFNDLKEVTCPNDGYLLLEVVPELG